MMLDTSFVVALLREQRRQIRGPASSFLRQNQNVRLRMPLYAKCELELGAERSTHPERERRAVQSLTEFVEPVFPGPGFALIYAQTVASLLAAGTPVPVMDALIGALALEHSEPLVTRDAEHFSRIPGLVVLDYAG
jgi:tRNA(fMet)-specific endonuclease VapC